MATECEVRKLFDTVLHVHGSTKIHRAKAAKDFIRVLVRTHEFENFIECDISTYVQNWGFRGNRAYKEVANGA